MSSVTLIRKYSNSNREMKNVIGYTIIRIINKKFYPPYILLLLLLSGHTKQKKEM